MAYATVADVQARVLQSLVTLGPATEPSESTVEGWIDGASAWIDGALSWKYQVPVTDATDLALLKPICSAWVAAQVYDVLEGHPPRCPPGRG
jgi:phage gp36-like protein